MRRLASPAPSASSASTGRAPSGRLTQRSPTRSSSASATSRLPPPMSPTRPIGRKKPEITPCAAKWASSAPLSTRSCTPDSRRDRGHQVRAVGGAPDRLGGGGVEAGHAHGVGDGAKPAHRLDRAPEALGGDLAGLRQPLAEPAQRLLVEARQGRAAELVVDDEADRVRADVDHAVGSAIGAGRARSGIELERARAGRVRALALAAHGDSSLGSGSLAPAAA